MKRYNWRRSLVIDGHRYDFKARTREELYKKIEKKKEEIEKKQKIKKSALTVRQWIDICLDQYKTNVTSQTLTGYRSKCRSWIYPVIGSELIRDVTPLQCQSVLNRMQGYAQDTAKKVRELMFFSFEKAVINGYILNNPATYVTLPRGVSKQKRRAITEYEREAVLSVSDKDPRYVYFLFMLFCGCRPSEVAEIQYRDIQDQTLHIRGTKTAAADRYVPIPEYLSVRLSSGDPYTYMFRNSRGGKLTPGNRDRLWKTFRRALDSYLECNVSKDELNSVKTAVPTFTPYCLRHTYATDLMRAGVDIRTAQYLMGHSSIKMTADVYTHVDTDAVRDAKNKLDTFTTTNIAKNSTNPEKNTETEPEPLKSGESTWPSHGQIMGSIPVGGTRNSTPRKR